MRFTFLTTALLVACGGAPEPRQPVARLSPDPKVTAPAALPEDSADRTKLPTPASEIRWTPPPVATWKMPNGLEVWYLRQKQAPLVSFRLVLASGASSDPTGKAGLTGLMADMLDEGAAGKSALQLADAWQRLATDYGASANTDGVVFSMELLADKLEPSLALLADVLLRPEFPKEEFARRKELHLAHALAQEADISNSAFVVLRRALFGDGYGAFPSGGLRGTLEAISLIDVKRQYKAVAKPEGAVVIVVGDVERPTLEKALTDALGGWKGKPTATPARVSEKAPDRAIYLVDYPGQSQSVVALARRVEGSSASDLFPTKVYNWTLGGAFTSRFNMNLREDKGWTYGASSAFNRWQATGMHLLYSKVKADKTRASIDEAYAELKGLHGEKPQTAEEHGEAVGGMLKSFPGRFEAMSGVASQLAELRLDGRAANYFETWPDKVRGVTLDQAHAAAKSYGNGADFIVVVTGDRKLVEPTLQDLGLPIVLCDAQGKRLPPEKKPKDATPPKEKQAPKAAAPAKEAQPEKKPAAEQKPAPEKKPAKDVQQK